MRRLVISTIFVCLFAASLHGQTRTWGFENGTFQGWSYINVEGAPFVDEGSEIGWAVSRDVIDAGGGEGFDVLQGSTVDGPGSVGSPQRIPNFRVVPDPFANRDCDSGQFCSSHILRSPTFKLGEGPISVDIIGGQGRGGGAPGENPFGPIDFDLDKSGSGWQGFALYDVEADEYVAWGYSTFNNDGKERDGRDVWDTVTIPQEELASLANDGRDYQIDVFDSHSGGWGWIGFDTVRVPDAGVGADVLLPGQEEWRAFRGLLPGRVEEVPVDADGRSWLDQNYDFDSIEATTISGTVEGWEWESVMAPTYFGSPNEPTPEDIAGFNPDANAINPFGGGRKRAATVFRTNNFILNKEDLEKYGALQLDLYAADFAAVYINGQLVHKTNEEVEEPFDIGEYYAGETLNADGERGIAQIQIPISEGLLQEGANFAAIQLHNDEDESNDDLSLGFYLEISGVEVSCVPVNELAGDFDGNGTVEFADFLTLSASFGTQVSSYEAGDIDCDGTVEFDDFLTLSSNFGSSLSAAGASVPEPAGNVLLMLALMISSLRRRPVRS